MESERWAFFLYYSLARVLSNVKIVQCDEILRLMLSFFLVFRYIYIYMYFFGRKWGFLFI